MNLLLILFLFLNAAHFIFTVNERQFEKIRPTFDEIYGKGWDKDGHQQIKVETSPLNSGENALNEQADHDDNIDQDVEAYNSDSTDQNLTQEDPDSTDQNLTQEDPDRIDQNLTQEDPDRIDQGDDETIERIDDENKFSEQEKREIICKFHAMKEEYKKKGKFPIAERVKTEGKIGKDLGVYREKIYKWKKEFGLNKKSFYEKKKREFIAKIEQIKMCQYGEQNKRSKDLGVSKETFCCWKKEFGLPVNSQIIYSESEKLELMGKYYKIKQKNPKLNVTDIAKKLNIARATLYRWKQQFGPKFDKNSVNEHLLPENRQTFAANDTSEHPMDSPDDNL